MYIKEKLSIILNKYKNLPLGVKASLWFMVCSFFQKGISMITTPIFTRLLSASEYGEYSLYVSWLNIIVVMVSFKLAGGVYQQALVKYECRKEELTSSLQGLTTLLVSISFIVYIIFRDFFENLFGLNTVLMCAMFVSIFSTSIYDLWAYRQRTDYNYRSLVIITLLIGLAKPVSGIIFVCIFESHKVEARIISLAAIEFFAYIGLYVLQFLRNRKFFSSFFWKYALRFNIPLLPHYLSQTILGQSDKIMIDKMCGTQYVGIYSLDYTLAQMMTLVSNAIKDALSPWIYKNIKSKNFKEIGNLANRILILVAGMDLMLILWAPEIIHIFAPPSYYDAIWIVPPVAMSVYFTFMYCLFADFEFFYEKTTFIMYASMVGAVLNIFLNCIFIKIFGYIAAGYTTLVCYIIYCVGHYFAMRMIEKKQLDNIRTYNIAVIILISLLFMILGFLAMFLYNYLILRMVYIVILMIVFISKKEKIKCYLKYFKEKKIEFVHQHIKFLNVFN